MAPHFKTIEQYLESLAPHFKTIGQYLEGLAPHQDNWAVLGRFGAPNFPWSLVAKWLVKNFKYHFCPSLVFISIKSLFEDVPLWMMENNLDKLRSIEDKLNYLWPTAHVLARIYNLQHVVRLWWRWMGENQNKTEKCWKWNLKKELFSNKLIGKDRKMGNSLISLSSLFINSIVTWKFFMQKHIFTKYLWKSTTYMQYCKVSFSIINYFKSHTVSFVASQNRNDRLKAVAGKSSVLSVVQPNLYPCYVVYSL